VDARPSQKKFAEEMGVEFTMLSDFGKSLSRLYGVLDEERGMARRTTFVIDKAGIIRHIDSGADAIDIAGVKAACGQLQ
jgi:peroxiredoxin